MSKLEAFSVLGVQARLKCVFPEEMAGLTWYVNGSEQPIEWRLLSEDYQGHSLIAQYRVTILLLTSLRRNPTKPVINYIWAVFHISDNVLINSMEVLYKNIAPDGITATCISNGETSLAVAVNYTRGCRRDSG